MFYQSLVTPGVAGFVGCGVRGVRGVRCRSQLRASVGQVAGSAPGPSERRSFFHSAVCLVSHFLPNPEADPEAGRARKGRVE